MKKILVILMIAVMLIVSAAAAAEQTPTYSEYKELGRHNMIAYQDGKAYAFYGLGKFDLEKPYRHGDAPDYTVFTKYYGFDLSKIEKRDTEYYDEETGVTVFGTSTDAPTKETCGLYAERFALYEDVVYGSEKYDFSEFAGTVPDGYVSADYTDRLVGMAYSTWMYKGGNPYSNSWESPYIGNYTSLDSPETLKAHAELLYDAGVDFIFVDWSNNVDYDFYNKKDYKNGARRNDFETIESATTQIFESWSKIENSPNIAVFIGCPGDSGAVKDGRLQKKADQVYREYLENAEFAKKYQTFNGKPLLLVYLGTPAFTSGNPAKTWGDDRFTVRFVTGYLGQQGLYNAKTRACKYPIWSWEEREQQVYAIDGKNIECMTVHSCYRKQDEPGSPNYIPAAERNSGKTFLQSWARAIEFGPEVVLCTTWNEYSKGEQPTVEINKDVEPTKQSGTLYYDILKEQIKIYKNISEGPSDPETTESAETAAETENVTVIETEAKTDPVTEKKETEGENEPEVKKNKTNPAVIIAAAVAGAAVIAAVIAVILKKRGK